MSSSVPARPRGARKPSTLAAFVRKEMHHILRDRQTLAILLLMPLVQVLLFGYALRTDVQDLRVAVVDPTPDPLTIRLRNRLDATPRFRIVSVSASTSALEGQFQRRAADMAIVLPTAFAEDLARGPARNNSSLFPISFGAGGGVYAGGCGTAESWTGV